MHLLAVLNRLHKQSGFTLIELLVVTVIIGISAAIATPNLLASQRKEKSTEVFTKIRSALVEAQTAANRTSNNCTVTINTTTITGTPVGCVSEAITFDSSIVSVTSTAGNLPREIIYNFEGNTAQAQTITVAPKDFSGNAITANAKCIEIFPNLGMIRTGLINGGNCDNNENKRYDNSL